MPGDLLGHLLAQVGQRHREYLNPNGMTLSGLTARETQILKLASEGYDTAGIALMPLLTPFGKEWSKTTCGQPPRFVLTIASRRNWCDTFGGRQRLPAPNPLRLKGRVLHVISHAQSPKSLTVAFDPPPDLGAIRQHRHHGVRPALGGISVIDTATNTVTATHTVGYSFHGFFAPVDNPPTLNQAHDTVGGSGLSFDSSTNTYTYVWKTSKAWAGTCQRFDLRLNDGTDHTADFQFNN